jgi:GT2 family glycosyltransferase
MTNITLLCANRPRLLKQALDSIGDLSDVHVAIRDAGMNPEVLQIIKDWGKDKNCYLTTTPDKIGTGEARNRVIGMSRMCAQGKYLYLGDDDVFFLRPDWLNVLIAAYEQAWEFGYRVLTAYAHPYNGPIAGEVIHVPAAGHECGVYPVMAIATQSMLMRWSVFDEFGPFCLTPAGKVCQSEDVDFGNRVRAAGYKLGLIKPALLVNTGITNSFGEKIVGWEMVKAEAPEGVLVE